MSKRYREKAKLVDKTKYYEPGEALELLTKVSSAKFDESVDLAIKLGVDLKKKSVSVRGLIDLPSGSGKKVKVAAIVPEDRVEEAKKAGADVCGAQDLIDKISKGFLGFDVLIADPEMMPKIGKLGKTLGTRGLMPNPKSGTVVKEVEKTIKGFKSGKIEFRMDKGGVVHLLLGKVKFEKKALLENLKVAVAAVQRAKPSGIKGIFIKSLTISPTMGPGIKLDPKYVVETS